MATTKLRAKDWEHRLHILWAWRKCRQYSTSGNRDEGAIYRAVLDGCAITVRALCQVVGIKCQFRNQIFSDGQNRIQQLHDCCKTGKGLLEKLPIEDQRCLLEVLYLGNRAIAHPDDGELDHKVDEPEMTSAINTVLELLRRRHLQWPELQSVPKEILQPITK